MVEGSAMKKSFKNILIIIGSFFDRLAEREAKRVAAFLNAAFKS